VLSSDTDKTLHQPKDSNMEPDQDELSELDPMDLDEQEEEEEEFQFLDGEEPGSNRRFQADDVLLPPREFGIRRLARATNWLYQVDAINLHHFF
jgi:hypothetical protein